MSYEALLTEGSIRKQTPDPGSIHDLLAGAERDVSVAAQTLDVDADWAFNIAYNAILRASRAYMFKQGYRPRGPEGHITVVRFLKEALGEALSGEVATFDQMRRKRNIAVYEASGRIGRQEAEQAVSFARNFLAKIRGLID